MSKNCIRCDGYLDYKAKGTGNAEQWQKRYFVLYIAMESNEARLDWYEDEKAFKSKKKVRKTIYFEEIEQIVPSRLDGRYTVELVLSSGDKPKVFAANSSAELEGWLAAFEDAKKRQPTKPEPTDKREPTKPEPTDSRGVVKKSAINNPVYDEDDSEFKENALYESVDSAPFNMYDVEAMENEANCRCKLIGSYKLQITSVNLTLRTADAKDPILVWPYRYIRRYGRNATSFTFEAGRKCESGHGLFGFKTALGYNIFAAVQKMTSHMRLSKSDTEMRPPSGALLTPTDGPSVKAMKRQLESQGAKLPSPTGDKPMKPPKPHARDVPQYSAVNQKAKKDAKNTKRASNGAPLPDQPQVSPKKSKELKNRVPVLPMQRTLSREGADCVDGDYALYDVAAAARVSQDYSNPQAFGASSSLYEDDDHLYAEPEELVDDEDGKPKMSQILAQMNKMKLRGKHTGSTSQYDEVDLSPDGKLPSYRASDSDNDYGELCPSLEEQPSAAANDEPDYAVVDF